ncbi:PA2778 family cysteine peptidase [Sediminicurvatus halobius]|uniref:Peptidase C39-like domain-containing protein n=1 Tax=Sediminicurvatus halobius TaxID=2182432 RepID=A0A2U2N7F6_9GAMM|nr:PA2778 family cysteine peptidase [Spiribacter halobius]PWG65096.1 hypothetical protein DEM34_02105 [Spiribacter halobius]UEX78956.1 PA2778 family cysteine peptidase [Spiribacter halobius]
MAPHRRAAWPSAALCLLLTLALAGCGSLPREQTALSDRAPAAELTDVPFFPDTSYYCGPAALATTLVWSGVETTPEDLAGRLIVPDRGGTLQPEMLATARSNGRLAYVIEPDLHALTRELLGGQPVIVLQNLGLDWVPYWHYAVAVGIDPDSQQVILRSGEHRRHLTETPRFARTWARGERWAMVTPAPGMLPATAEPGPLFRALAALEESADTAAALPYWQAAVSRWPRSGLLALGLANALHDRERTAAARDALARAAETAEDHRGDVLNNLARLELALGNTDAALEAARSAVAVGGERMSTYRRTLERVRCEDSPADCRGTD